MNDFIEREAEDDSGDESIDEEIGDVRRRPATNGKLKRTKSGDIVDSSEEEDTEDEEEGLAKVKEGFIVDDEDEEEEEEEDAEEQPRSRRRRKRRRPKREDEDGEDIDDEDLELIAENTGQEYRADQHKLKRLKRGRAEERPRQQNDDLGNMFSEDDSMDDIINDDDALGDRSRRNRRRDDADPGMEDFDNFIVDDEDEDEEEDGMNDRGPQESRANKVTSRAGYSGGLPGHLANSETIEQMQEIFGNGDEYDWAMQTAEHQEYEANEQVLELKDVFEPSELQERMLTDEDNQIRALDIPERFQVARAPYAHIEISDQEFLEEGNWVANDLIQKLRPPIREELRDPFFASVKKVLDFLIKQNMEVPFIYQNRKDYLIHAEKYKRQGPDGQDVWESGKAERLLKQEDLWTILDLDLKFRAFVDKRNALKRTYASLERTDAIFEERIVDLQNVEEIQDLHDYIHFQYAEELKDLAIIASMSGTDGTQKKRPGTTRSLWERIRKAKVYGLVKEFGLSAEQFANNAKFEQKREWPEDPSEFPSELADMYTDDRDFTTSIEALKAAKMMLAEEMYMNPILRRVMRGKIFISGLLQVDVTEKGVKKIDELHPYYDFKYLKNQTIGTLLQSPARFLRMLQAEEEKLIEIQIDVKDRGRMMTQFDELLLSENYSDQAEAWNEERKEVLEMAIEKLLKLMAKNFREVVKTRCETDLAKECRKAYMDRLDQAPYHAKGLKIGEIPRVFAVSNGNGEFGKDATMGIFMDEDGRVLESVKYSDLKDVDEKNKFVEVLNRRRPDVLAVGGFMVSTNRLIDELRRIVEDENLTILGADSGDGEDERTLLEVVFVQDEVARLYMNSERALQEHVSLPPVARYCVGLARYMQNPLLEYAALGKDIVSINFHPDQQLVSEEKLRTEVEQAMVDMVNLVGVDINLAAKNSYVANTVPFICGLGPRKATHVLKMIDANDGVVISRSSLVGDPENNILPVVGPVVFTNCASFIKIEYDSVSNDSEYLDNTRVHPEDYELGRKMASDALELDEEDVANITDGGNDPGAIVRQLVEGDEQEKVNELILEEYAEELEKNFNQRKRATLETIRAELQVAYEELRNPFRKLTAEQIFTKLTGETDQTLHSGMVVPVSIRRVSDRYIAARLDCGVEGNVASEEISDRSDNLGISPHTLFHVSQTVQAKIKSINIKTFYAELTLKESEIRNPYRKPLDKMPDEWDEDREERDRVALAVTTQEEHRTARVIKHPLFRPFNSRQAEEYLAQHSRGDAVIRPSSKGQDHIAITWKVDEGVYQHIDVLELGKENEFSVGRTLKVAGKYSYSDLDDLIFNHVKSMSRKVEELEQHERYKNMPKDQVDQWLTTYTEANPKRAIYAFCINPARPGRFDLCFKNGLHSRCRSWEIQVVPQAYMLQRNVYPDMTALCNGFKILHTNFQQKQQQDMMRNNGHHRGPLPRR